MALWLAENEPRDYEFICTPTGDELPEMIQHWEKISGLLGKPLTRLTTGLSLKSNNVVHRSLPSWRMRFCTVDLKLKPYIAFMLTAAPAVSYVGLRADEPDREGIVGKAGGEVYGNVEGITQRFPLRELGWGVADVWAYLDSKGVTIPKRTDCARCFYQRLIEWYELWKDHPEIYADAELEESFYKHTYRSPGRDTWPAALVDLRKEFESGRIPKDTRLRTSGDREDMCRRCSL